jgi:thiosulfate dehydrogenase [quinone] large subunit
MATMTRPASGAPDVAAPRSRLVLRDHPLEVALFNNVGPVTFVWLVLRLWLGWQWITAGWEKIGSPDWMSGKKIAGFWQTALSAYGKPNAPVAFDWYHSFLQTLVNGHAETWFAPLIAWAEFLGGLALAAGLLTGLAAFALAFLNFNYMLAGSAGVNPLYFVVAILLLLAWKNAGWWGLDRFILPALAPPEKPGSMFDPDPAAAQETHRAQNV